MTDIAKTPHVFWWDEKDRQKWRNEILQYTSQGTVTLSNGIAIEVGSP